MRITRLAALVALGAQSVTAFAPQATPNAAVTRSLSSPRIVAPCWATQESSICDVPDDVDAVQLLDMPQGGKILQHLELTAADGTTVTLGSKMGRGTSVVVFLRHLG